MIVGPRARRALVAVLLAGPVVATAGLAHAQDELDPVVEEPEPIRLELVEQELAFTPGDDIRLVYEVTGDLLASSVQLPATENRRRGEQVDEPEPPGLTVQVANYPPTLTKRTIDQVIGPDVDRNAFGEAVDGVEILDARDLIEIEDGVGRLELVVPTDVRSMSQPDRLGFALPGVHPLRIELVLYAFGSSLALTTAGTVVQALPAEGPSVAPLNLALMGAVGEIAPTQGADAPAEGAEADDAPDGEATAGQLDTTVDATDATDRITALTRFAGAVDAPTTLSLPPVPLAEVAAESDESETRLQEDLADDELVSRPALPFDVSSAAAVDRVDAFSRQLRAGEDLLTDTVPATPVRRDAWIALEPLSADGAQVLRDVGVRYVVMTADLYTSTVDPELPATDRFVQIALPDGGRLPLLVVDDLGEELLPGPTGGLGRPEWAVRTAAVLLLESGLRDPTTRRSRAVAAPDLGPLDPRKVTALEAVVETTPSLRFTSGSALTGITDIQQRDRIPVIVELPAEAGTSLDARVEFLGDAGTTLLGAAAMLPEGDPRPPMWAEELDELVSTAYSDEEVEQRVGAMVDEADEIKGSVVPPEPFTFTLTNKSGEIAVPIQNTSDDPLRVRVELSSPKLVFPDGVEDVVLQPGETRLEVPVDARTNGTAAVTVTVSSPSGEELAEPVRLTSRVTTFSGVGQVLTGGLILVLLTWWFTHWRQRRRAALTEGAERHPAGAGSIARP